ncbi:nickel pincer cofactor biosynthesis protein LarB [bacterium]|nr:nickel pincer cofactor biosynthesis protein LarB [bacterium]
MTGDGGVLRGFARLDIHRSARTGEPEVVFGEGKTPDQVASIVSRLLADTEDPVLVTRATPQQAAVTPGVYDPVGRTIISRARKTGAIAGSVAIVTAGTSDLPVAREAAGTLDALGMAQSVTPDIGVAGLHRALEAVPTLEAASACIVVAGMDGALPSVLAGLLPLPIIAVPTSVGYGAAFEGLAALLAMMASCAPGVAVVNIDSGFGAAMHAMRIANAQ